MQTQCDENGPMCASASTRSFPLPRIQFLSIITLDLPIPQKPIAQDARSLDYGPSHTPSTIGKLACTLRRGGPRISVGAPRLAFPGYAALIRPADDDVASRLYRIRNGVLFQHVSGRSSLDAKAGVGQFREHCCSSPEIALSVYPELARANTDLSLSVPRLRRHPFSCQAAFAVRQSVE